MGEIAHDFATQIDFCTMGMLIVDEIHFGPARPPVTDILGGGGTYAAVGARIVSPPPLSKTVGWIADAGHDFPVELRHVIASWQTSCLVRETPERATTRGWNGYGENEQRAFNYTTPKLRLDATSLSPRLLQSKSFHLLCSPLRCIDLVQTISSRRRDLDTPSLGDPLWIWEPVPDLCIPTQLANCIDALKLIDVLSPNHDELCAFFDQRAYDEQGRIDESAIEQCALRLLCEGIGRNGNGSIVVRCGKSGCMVATRDGRRWLPAYHQDPDKVVDPTGGGNAFLGALTITMARQLEVERSSLDRVVEAAIAGNVGASFTIEQIGMPLVAVDSEGREVWNGESVSERIASFGSRSN